MSNGVGAAQVQGFTGSVKRLFLQMAAWAAVVTAGFYFAGHADKIAGFLAGTTVSAVYFLLLWYRVRKSAAMPPKQAVAYMRMGWLVRLSFVALSVVLMLKVPALNFAGAILGLFTFKIVVVLNGLFLVFRRFSAR